MLFSVNTCLILLHYQIVNSIKFSIPHEHFFTQNNPRVPQTQNQIQLSDLADPQI